MFGLTRPRYHALTPRARMLQVLGGLVVAVYALLWLYLARREPSSPPLSSARPSSSSSSASWFSTPLPRYQGPYAVGTIDVEVPLTLAPAPAPALAGDQQGSSRRTRKVADHVLRETGRPAFELETVLFTLFYPVDGDGDGDHHEQDPDPYHDHDHRRRRHLWNDEIDLTARGYARLARIGDNFVTRRLIAALMRLAVGATEIPAAVDAPLARSSRPASASPADNGDQEEGDQARLFSAATAAATATRSSNSSSGSSDTKFPVIVFSHGHASRRADYSAYLGSLAARGVVVAAVEHRDGSGPGSAVVTTNTETTTATTTTTTTTRREVLHLTRGSALQPAPGSAELKQIQLAFRQAEVEETVRVLAEINAPGGGAGVHARNTRGGEGAGLGGWEGRLDFGRLVMGGHSFGATLALQALKKGDEPASSSSSSSSSSTSLPQLPPFSGGIILDPGKSSGPLNADLDVPVLVMHSESWSSTGHRLFQPSGRPHFDTVRAIARGLLDRGVAAWFLTARRTAHPSVTDAALIEPALVAWATGTAAAGAREAVMRYVAASASFVRFLRTGQREQGPLSEQATSPDFIDKGLVAGPWQVHASPWQGRA